MANQIEKLASAIRNDVVSGLQGYHTNLSMSLEQLEDDIIDERLLIIKEYIMKGILPYQDLFLSINCIPIDCKDIDRCNKCLGGIPGIPMAHFEIPQVIFDFGDKSIAYIGPTDRQQPFRYSTSVQNHNIYNRYRKRNKNKPFVLIDPTPNENGMYDCFLFNAPLMKQISIVAIFKDPRQLDRYGCCNDEGTDHLSFINNEIKKRLTAKKIQYYRQYAAAIAPNDQKYSAG